MSLRISATGRPGGGLQTVLLRLARKARTDAARLAGDREDRTHSIRTGIKKYRALLRLAETEMGRSDLRRLKRLMSTLKGELAASRDKLVVAETARAVLGADAASGLDAPRPAGTDGDEKIEVAARELVDRTAGLDLVGVGRGTMKKRWMRTLRRARRAMAAARRSGDAGDFHRWRKRAKDLWYQGAALQEVLKDAEKSAASAKKLSSILGSEHDLTVTMESLGGLSGKDRRKLERRREKLRRQALDVGAGI